MELGYATLVNETCVKESLYNTEKYWHELGGESCGMMQHGTWV
jgi:hypothetical protein